MSESQVVYATFVDNGESYEDYTENLYGVYSDPTLAEAVGKVAQAKFYHGKGGSRVERLVVNVLPRGLDPFAVQAEIDRIESNTNVPDGQVRMVKTEAGWRPDTVEEQAP